MSFPFLSSNVPSPWASCCLSCARQWCRCCKKKGGNRILEIMAEHGVLMFLRIHSDEQPGRVVGKLSHPPRSCSSRHQGLVPPFPHSCAKEQRKLCRSNSSCTLLSDLISLTALFISLPVHNFQWLPITPELKIGFLVWHSGHIWAPASLSGLIACICFIQNEPLATPWISLSLWNLGLSALSALLGALTLSHWICVCWHHLRPVSFVFLSLWISSSR